ncbi:MAG TPA: protein-disulfide reductase DsbD domain-containing protein [Pseudolabrys sp.]|jgi:DsbC/DsbD-like thiol-disulfide interchange protein|nr:protein-disulfide reductase DsbD domain-containing protein [Pseudolabrys sp.]
MVDRHNRFSIAAAACGLALTLAAPAHAAGESPWVEDSHSALRLIGGNNASGATSLRAGIQLRLEPGWHTYWRYPGDSGVPPRFSFPGSDNVASVKVLYPAPHAYSDEAGVIIGYKGGVIFPLRVVARDKSKPVTLHLKAEYAICDKLCVPVEAQAQLTLTGATAESDALLASAEAHVPKEISAAAVGLKAHIASDHKVKPLVFVDLKAPTGKPIEIFVEGPTAEWALPIPKPAPGAPAGHQYFGFELDGLPPGVNPRGAYELTFTIVGDGQPVEAKTHLD